MSKICGERSEPRDILLLSLLLLLVSLVILLLLLLLVASLTISTPSSVDIRAPHETICPGDSLGALGELKLIMSKSSNSVGIINAAAPWLPVPSPWRRYSKYKQYNSPQGPRIWGDAIIYSIQPPQGSTGPCDPQGRYHPFHQCSHPLAPRGPRPPPWGGPAHRRNTTNTNNTNNTCSQYDQYSHPRAPRAPGPLGEIQSIYQYSHPMAFDVG